MNTENSTSKRDHLLVGPIAPALVSFALPFMAASFLQSIYGAVDLFVVGQYANSAAVSAVSIGSSLMTLVLCLMMGLSMGGTVRIGFQIGAKNDDGAARAVGNLAFLFVLLTIVTTPLMLVLTNPLVSLMQTPAEAVADCRTYLTICSCGLPFIIGYNAVSGVYRGIGDSRTPVIFIAIACVVNILLDFLLTGYLGMGAAGAAYATICAQGVSFVFALVHIVKKGFLFPIHRKHFRPRKSELIPILTVGTPLALQDVLVHFSFLAIAAIINSLGLIASAAVGVAEKLMGFAFLVPGAFSSAVATMVAQNVGARQYKRSRDSMAWGCGIALICGIVICVLCWLIPDQLIGIFSRDPEVIAAGGQYIRTYSIDCVLTAFVFNFNAYLNGNGKSMLCFVHSVAATFLMRIPVTWLMSRISQNTLLPMGLAAPAASLLSILICAFFMVRYTDDLHMKDNDLAPITSNEET